MRSRIAVVQATWSTDTETNVSQMERLVREVHAGWGDAVRLVTFCEFAVCGWSERILDVAEEIPGPSTERLAALAKETGYYISNGSMAERVGDRIANTTVIVSPDGEIIHKYRKTHAHGPPVGVEDIVIGREFPVADIPGVGKVGTMICYDGFFPEVARSLVHNGAEIILWNTMAYHPLKDLAVMTAQVRAAENACYVVMAAGSGMHAGVGLHGNSLIADPNGVCIARVDEAPTIFVDIVDTGLVSVVREEGVKGILAPLIHVRELDHEYPHERAARHASGGPGASTYWGVSPVQQDELRRSEDGPGASTYWGLDPVKQEESRD